MSSATLSSRKRLTLATISFKIKNTMLGHQQSPQGMIRAANRCKEDESASLLAVRGDGSLPGIPTRNTVVVIMFVWSFCLQLPR